MSTATAAPSTDAVSTETVKPVEHRFIDEVLNAHDLGTR
jgi:hypothetical protein